MKWESLYKILGGRKAVAFGLTLSVGIIFQSLGTFTETFSYFLLGLAGIYVAGNAVSKKRLERK